MRAGAKCSSTGPFTAPDTHGRAAAPPGPIPIRADRMQRGKCCASSSTMRCLQQEGKRGRATGVVVLCNGRIMGGDSHFYYTGTYSCKNGRWRGETINHQHAEAPGINLAFGGRDVTCGFTGTYSHGEAEIDATAL